MALSCSCFASVSDNFSRYFIRLFCWWKRGDFLSLCANRICLLEVAIWHGRWGVWISLFARSVFPFLYEFVSPFIAHSCLDFFLFPDDVIRFRWFMPVDSSICIGKIAKKPKTNSHSSQQPCVGELLCGGAVSCSYGCRQLDCLSCTSASHPNSYLDQWCARSAIIKCKMLEIGERIRAYDLMWRLVDLLLVWS